MDSFSELIQTLVCTEALEQKPHKRQQPLGSRLRALQARRKRNSRAASKIDGMDTSSTEACDRMGADLGRLSVKDQSAAAAFNLSDFIYVDKLVDASQASERSHVHKFLSSLNNSGTWKQVASNVALLLASVAFAVVLLVISGMRFPNYEYLRAITHPLQIFMANRSKVLLKVGRATCQAIVSLVCLQNGSSTSIRQRT